MSSPSSHFALDAAVPSPGEQFSARLGALYFIAQRSAHLFASPIGPFSLGGAQGWLPRFVFFGPYAESAPWRLAFLSGFEAGDFRPARALLRFVEHLAHEVDDAHGLDLTFFPLVNASGATRSLAGEHWGRSASPEIDVLEKDARLRGYHGYIRIEAAEPGEELITLRVREPHGLAASPDVELITSEDVEPFPVRFERGDSGAASADGPLSVADDLPVQPFELTLRLPALWPDDVYETAASLILTRFVRRYRALLAYGQHL